MAMAVASAACRQPAAVEPNVYYSAAWLIDHADRAALVVSAAPARRGSRWRQPVVLAPPNRNANPLNIKFGAATERYVTLGIARRSVMAPADGGAFLAFVNPESGFRAAADLLRSAHYAGLPLDRALRRWSGEGYGAEILSGTGIDRRRRVGDLDRWALATLITRMATVEGYRSLTIVDEVARALRQE